jgi:hypothetical protein
MISPPCRAHLLGFSRSRSDRYHAGLVLLRAGLANIKIVELRNILRYGRATYTIADVGDVEETQTAKLLAFPVSISLMYMK